MLDKLSNGVYPPFYELPAIEVLEFLRIQLSCKNVGYLYQIYPCKSKGIESLDFQFCQPLARVMLQACLNNIAAQTQTAFPCKCL